MDNQSKDKRGEVRLANWWVRQELREIPTRAAMLVYLTLRTYRNHASGECYPGMEKKLCKHTGLRRETISRALRELEAIGLVEIRQLKWDKTQRFSNNTYRVLDEATRDIDIRPKRTKTV